MNSGETGKEPANKDGSDKERVNNTALRLFTMAVLDMSWQLAIVVLVPVIGGYELDKHMHSTPWLTIIGFVLAMAGAYFVMKRMLKEYGGKTVNNTKEAK